MADGAGERAHGFHRGSPRGPAASLQPESRRTQRSVRKMRTMRSVVADTMGEPSEVLHLQARPIPEGLGARNRTRHGCAIYGQILRCMSRSARNLSTRRRASCRSRSVNSCGLRSSPRRQSSASTNPGPIASSHCSSCIGIRDERTTARHGQARAQNVLKPAQIANRLNFSVPVGLSIRLDQVLKPGLRNRHVRMIP